MGNANRDASEFLKIGMSIRVSSTTDFKFNAILKRRVCMSDYQASLYFCMFIIYQCFVC